MVECNSAIFFVFWAYNLYKGYTVSNKPGEGDKTEQSTDSENSGTVYSILAVV